MNRLLILLFMVGWAFYIVQVTLPADAVQSEQNAKTSRQAAPGQQAVTQSEIQPIARAEVRSPHAITPDEPPQKAAVPKLLLRRCCGPHHAAARGGKGAGRPNIGPPDWPQQPR